MKVKFANGVVKECQAPTEQKIFRNNNGEPTGVGWMLLLRLTGVITSTDLDNIVTDENIASLEFLSENENGEDITLFTLDGYKKITSSTIRHAEDTNSTHAEIQLTKGV